jgi:dTDP-4-amino-4,6-dideoxygalactose transaminase
MLNTTLAPWPSFSEDEIEAVAEILRSGRINYWTGEQGRLFEGEFARFAGTKHAIALANGTVALDLALRGLGIGEGDEVIVTPRTFIASVSAVVNAGAVPVFADVDRHSGNLSAETIAPVVTDRTRAILPVHLGGWPVDMDPILELAKPRGIKIIEDCAQAHGAMYKGRSVGAFGEVNAWSFCQDKIMTTGGEGGMVTVDDDALWDRMWSYKDHGKSREAVFNRSHPPGFRWLHESFGTNWRLTEMQAAIGRIQLNRMPDWHARRTANAETVMQALEPLSGPAGPVRVPRVPGHSVHAYYRLYCYVRPENLAPRWTRDRIVEEIVAAGVPCFQGSCSEIYLEKAFDGTGFPPKDRLPVAKELGETSLMFLVHPTLTAEDIEKSVEAAVRVLGAAAA